VGAVVAVVVVLLVLLVLLVALGHGFDRGIGCEYVKHRDDIFDSRTAPFCKATEQVLEIYKKYKKYQESLPLGHLDRPEPLEVCIQCGSPTHGHTHFDPLNPGQLKEVPASMLTTPGLSPYAVCPVGGRPVLIARMLAVRKVLLAHKADDPKNWKEIRKEAAFAAEEAPRNPELMERAKRLFAIEAKKRKFNNVGLNEDSGGEGYTGTGPVAPGDEEEKVAEEGDEAPPPPVAEAEAPANNEAPNPRGFFGNNNANFLGGDRRAKTMRHRLSAKRRGILKKRFTAKKLKN
jgi:hypothetical protein